MDQDRLSLLEALAAAFESTADMMLITERDKDRDVGWKIVYANNAFLEECGYELDEVMGTSPSIFVRRGERSKLDAAMKASHKDEDVQMDVPITRKDGTWFWGSWRARTVSHDSSGKRRRVIAVRNISDRVAAAERLAGHSQRLRQLHLVAASSGRSAARQIDAILEFGLQCFDLESAYAGRIDNRTFTFEHVIGDTRFKDGEMHVGRNAPLDEMALRFAIEANDVVAIDDLHELKATALDPDLRAYIGEPLIVRGALYGGVGFASRQARETTFNADDCDVMRLIAALIGSAIERGLQESRLDTLAFHDMLTGLPNRALLEDRLGVTLAAAKRNNRKCAVHLLDLDYFKEINDRGGHAAGDEALRIIARRFSSVLREMDTLARLGGDEFVVLQPNVDSDQDAAILAERIRATLAAPIIIADNRYTVDVTIGIAIFPRDGTDSQTLLRAADRAMYLGKAEGRGRVEFSKATV
jgi:diguanylate cyclase (GGDEF)-like protein/PAS domain S-box-containing protein